MFLKKRAVNWTKASGASDSWKLFGGMDTGKLEMLDAVWAREMGRLAEHCELLGVERCTILVRPRSAAAANELTLRSSVLVKSLNKHFKQPWIRAIKAVNKI